MLRRLFTKMDSVKRILKPSESSTAFPPLSYGQIMESSWFQQMRQLSSEIDAKKNNVETTKSQSSSGIEDNPYYAKYAERIKNKKQAEVTKDEPIVGVQPRVDDVKADKPADSTKVSDETKPKPQEQQRKVDTSALKPKSKKSLSDIVKVELFEDKSAEEITEIWASYHSKRDCIYAAIPGDVYTEFYANIKQYPMFILPLPRNNAQTGEAGDSANPSECYEFFFMQAQEHAVFFTSLAAIQLHKEMAPVSLTIYHYPELSESKNIVLMMGEYDTNLLNSLEVQCLANQLQYYFTTKDAASKLSLHLFNKEPKTFDYMRLIRHLEEGLISKGIGAVNLAQQD